MGMGGRAHCASARQPCGPGRPGPMPKVNPNARSSSSEIRPSNSMSLSSRPCISAAQPQTGQTHRGACRRDRLRRCMAASLEGPSALNRHPRHPWRQASRMKPDWRRKRRCKCLRQVTRGGQASRPRQPGFSASTRHPRPLRPPALLSLPESACCFAVFWGKRKTVKDPGLRPLVLVWSGAKAGRDHGPAHVGCSALCRQIPPSRGGGEGGAGPPPPSGSICERLPGPSAH